MKNTEKRILRSSLLLFLPFLFLFASFCSSSQDKNKSQLVAETTTESNSADSATLTIQKNLTVELMDGKLVNWPPIDKESVQVPAGKHVLSCSYRVTQTTRFVTTQQSVRNIIVDADFEKGKNYLLQYNLNDKDVQLSLQGASKDNSEDKQTSQPESDKE